MKKITIQPATTHPESKLRSPETVTASGENCAFSPALKAALLEDAENETKTTAAEPAKNVWYDVD